MRGRFPYVAGRDGFTLIEMVVALAIMVIILGGVFGAVRATLKISTVLHATQLERDGITGIFDLCQQTFPALPPAARMSWNDSGKPGIPGEMVLRDAPEAFPVDAQTLFFGETAMVARTQANGAFTLGLEYRRLDRDTHQSLPNPSWLPLLRDVQDVTWAFYDSSVEQWLPRWDDVGRRPTLIRLTLVLLGTHRAWSQVFWLPRTQPAMLAVQQAAPSVPPRP